jgi:hypothetical protein
LKLLDYHRLRNHEQKSWNHDRLREAAGSEFVDAAEALLPVHKETWRADTLMHFTREPWFEQCLELCDRYVGANDAQRTWLRSRVDRNSAGKIGLFGLRAAVLGARERSVSLARASLVAFAINDLAQRDVRDVLIGLSLLCHCAALAGADVPALFREVAAISGSAMKALYNEWANRYPGVQAIGSMGWREVETEDGIGFRH